MTPRRADRGMLHAIAHRGELANRSVQFFRLGREHLPVDPGSAIRREHPGDLLEREAGRTTERDQRQSLHHGAIEHATQALPAHGCDQAFLLVEAQRRRRHAGLLCHLGDVHFRHALDLKLT